MNRLFSFLSWLTIASMMSLILLVGFWMLYSYKTTTFTNPQKILNVNHTVKSGGYLDIEIDYCKYTKAVPLVTRHAVDGLTYTFTPEIATLKPLGCGKDLYKLYVPKALPKGSYYIETTYRYKVNPIRNIDVTVRTEQFTIE